MSPSILQLLAALVELVTAIVGAGKDPESEIAIITGRYRDAQRKFDSEVERRKRERFG